MVTGTFEVRPPHTVWFGGSFEAAKIRDFVKSAESTYTIVSVETISFVDQTQKFTLTATSQPLLDGATSNLQLYMPDVSIGSVIYTSTTEAFSDIGTGLEKTGSIVGHTVSNAVTPIVSSLTLPLIIVGIVGMAYISGRKK